MEQLTKNFHQREFACKCGCGFAHIDKTLVNHLQTLRDKLNKPIAINSACRCPHHNRRVHGEKHSYHLLGRAADIRVHGMPVAELHQHVIDSGLFKGIGFYPTKGFVHVDTRVRPGRWVG